MHIKSTPPSPPSSHGIFDDCKYFQFRAFRLPPLKGLYRLLACCVLRFMAEAYSGLRRSDLFVHMRGIRMEPKSLVCKLNCNALTALMFSRSDNCFVPESCRFISFIQVNYNVLGNVIIDNIEVHFCCIYYPIKNNIFPFSIWKCKFIHRFCIKWENICLNNFMIE